MNDYLSFEEVAGELRCNLKRVRSLVIESKTLKATRITKNGLILELSGLEGHFPYDLDFCCHLDDEGGITSDHYESNAVGKTVLTRTFDVGFLRVERSDLEKFITEHPNVLQSDALAHAAPVVPESQQPIGSAIAAAALRDLACRYSPELTDEMAASAPQQPEPAAVEALPTQHQTAAPTTVVADSASVAPGNDKVWTPGRLAEARAYREQHGTKKTAEYFGVSTSLIRRKLPRDKPKPKGYSAFTHRMK